MEIVEMTRTSGLQEVRISELSRKDRGFSMIEVLVTLVITLLGLLGVLGLQIKAQQTEFESYQRAQALVLLSDMTDRLQANGKSALCYDMTSWSVKYLGPESGAVPVACVVAGTANTQQIANNDLAAWRNALLGTSEKIGGASVGVLVGGRGCITRVANDATGEVYEIAVAWEGRAPTVTPQSTCASGLYASEPQRRILTKRVKIPILG